MQTDALLTDNHWPDIDICRELQKVVDRVAGEDLDPLSFHDLRDRSTNLHNLFLSARRLLKNPSRMKGRDCDVFRRAHWGYGSAPNENEVVWLLAGDAVDIVIDHARADDSRSSTVLPGRPQL